MRLSEFFPREYFLRSLKEDTRTSTFLFKVLHSSPRGVEIYSYFISEDSSLHDQRHKLHVRRAQCDTDR